MALIALWESIEFIFSVFNAIFIFENKVLYAFCGSYAVMTFLALT